MPDWSKIPEYAWFVFIHVVFFLIIIALAVGVPLLLLRAIVAGWEWFYDDFYYDWKWKRREKKRSLYKEQGGPW